MGPAGNKVRKLEIELAYARSLGATHLVTEGSRQSNATRAAAAAAAALGMRCTLVLNHHPTDPVGNVMLDALFGADIRLVGDVSWSALADANREVVAELTASGEHVHRLPIGCATRRGATSFAHAYVEAESQLAAQGVTAATIVHASSVGSTHAGLVLGRAIQRRSTRVLGVVVAPEMYDDVPAACARLAGEAASFLAPDTRVGLEDIELTEAYLGDGYGLSAPGVMEAIDLRARLEGIVVDPVYTGKAVAAIIDLARRDGIKGPVLSWHTGGHHAMFDPAHTRRVWSELPRLS